MGWYESYGDNYKNCEWIEFPFLEKFMRDALVAAEFRKEMRIS